MGWICRTCGTENPYSVNRCPVCEQGMDPGIRLNRERRLEKLDQMLYRLPQRSVHALRVNRILALTLAVLVILQGVSVLRSTAALPDDAQGLPALIARMGDRLTACGHSAADRVSAGGWRAAVQFSQTVNNLQTGGEKLLSHATGGPWSERAGRLQAVFQGLQPMTGLLERVLGISGLWQNAAGRVEAKLNMFRWAVMSKQSRILERVQVKPPPLAQMWENFRANISLQALWESAKGLLSIP